MIKVLSVDDEQFIRIARCLHGLAGGKQQVMHYEEDGHRKAALCIREEVIDKVDEYVQEHYMEKQSILSINLCR